MRAVRVYPLGRREADHVFSNRKDFQTYGEYALRFRMTRGRIEDRPSVTCANGARIHLPSSSPTLEPIRIIEHFYAMYDFGLNYDISYLGQAKASRGGKTPTPHHTPRNVSFSP